jgi:tetratricopeptide (TPR) repeat protein
MPTRPASRLLVLGWDAADWQLIDPLLARGAMPHLAALLARGTRADLRTLEPKLSPILWSSIATGKTADKHGILNFVEPNPSGDGVRVSSSTTRRTRALWNMLTLRGMRVHAVGWYASHPAEPIAGTCVTNLLMEQAPSSAGSPWPLMPGTVGGRGSDASTADRVARARVAPAEVGRDRLRDLLPSVAQASRGDARPATLAKEYARMLSLHRAALEVVRGGDWDCAMVFHDTIDTIGHHFMECRSPRMPHVKAADVRVYGEVMDLVYRRHDELLGELLDACGEGTSVILVSDHGFHSGADRPVIADVTKEERAALESRWHRPLGVAVFAGPGFRAGERIAAPSILDVAPTALAALGLPPGRDMDGRVVAEAFVEAPAAEPIASWDDEPGDAGEHPPEMRMDPFEAADALRQLVDLGYMADTGDDQRALLELTRRESRFNLAATLLTTGRPAGAAPILEELLRERPDEVRYLGSLAQAQSAAGMHDACIETCARWGRAAPDSQEHSALAIASLVASGRGAEAEGLLESLEASLGGSAPHARMLSELNARLGRWDASLAHARRAIATAPGLVEPHLSAATAALELGDFEAAAEHALDAGERSMVVPQVHFVLGAALAWGGELGHAAQAFDVAARMVPDYREALEFASAVARATGDAARADSLAAEASAGKPLNGPRPTVRDAASWARTRATGAA